MHTSAHSLIGVTAQLAAHPACPILSFTPIVLPRIVQRMTCAWLRSQLFGGDGTWREACEVFGRLGEHGKVERLRVKRVR